MLVEEVSREIRTISHLLHPPLLDVAGLVSALRWYVDGFSERSKIKVDLDIPSDFGRLPDEIEIAIFRIVQESLTNIHPTPAAAMPASPWGAKPEKFAFEFRIAAAACPFRRMADSTERKPASGFRACTSASHNSADASRSTPTAPAPRLPPYFPSLPVRPKSRIPIPLRSRAFGRLLELNPLVAQPDCHQLDCHPEPAFFAPQRISLPVISLSKIFPVPAP